MNRLEQADVFFETDFEPDFESIPKSSCSEQENVLFEAEFESIQKFCFFLSPEVPFGCAQ